MENETANIGKWYTVCEYYNEDGEQITKENAKKNYVITNKKINTKINGNTGTRTIWYKCERNKQYKLFEK